MDKTKAQLTSLIPMSDNSPAIDADQLIQRPPFDCFMDSAELDEIRSSKLPTYDELPNVPLYRDQVISYITLTLKPLDRCSSSEWLTPSMINNYVKMHLVSPPVKKQYGREQISRLLVICILKQFLSISAIEQLFKIQSVVSSPQEAYDHMVAEINHIIDMTFWPPMFNRWNALFARQVKLVAKSFLCVLQLRLLHQKRCLWPISNLQALKTVEWVLANQP